MRGDISHRGLDDGGLFFGGELDEVVLGGELDVGAEAVGVEAGLGDQAGVAAGDGLEVDVAAEAVGLAEGAGDFDELLHGVVGRLDDAGGEEEAFDVVALVEVEGEVDDFLRGEAGAAYVGGDAVDAEDAVVGAEVGEQDLEQGDAAAVGGVGVADALAVRGAEAAGGGRALGAGGGAGGVVLGGVGEDLEFLLDVHHAGALIDPMALWSWTAAVTDPIVLPVDCRGWREGDGLTGVIATIFGRVTSNEVWVE